jgi:hypothetical protein
MKKLGSLFFWFTVVAVLSFAWDHALWFGGPVLPLPRDVFRVLFYRVNVPVFPVICVLVLRYCLGLLEERVGHLKLTVSLSEPSASS